MLLKILISYIFFKDSEFAGHFVERLVTVYYLINNLNNCFLLNAIENFEFNSNNYKHPKELNPNRKDYYDYIVGKNTTKMKLNRWGNATYLL